MVLIYRVDGECVEVPGAMHAEVIDGSVRCLDAQGNIVASFPKEDVEVFTNDPEFAEVIKDEDCEETTTLTA